MLGLEKSNRSWKEHFPKGAYTSSFPVAMLSWMDREEIPPIFVECLIKDNELSFPNVARAADHVLCDAGHLASSYFNFETPFQDFRSRLSGDKGWSAKFDLVISDEDNEVQRFPFEVKNTVVPDHTTKDRPVHLQSTEMVLRPDCIAGTVISMMSRYDEPTIASLKRRIEERKLEDVRDWTNERDVMANIKGITSFVLDCLTASVEKQTPYIIHNVWGHDYDSITYDMFIWTDVAIVGMIFCEATKGEANAAKDEDKPGKMSRPLRTIVRFCKAMIELLERGKLNYESVFTKISFGLQTDKELNINGSRISNYITHNAMGERRIPVSAAKAICGAEGIMRLQPERRSDAALLNLLRGECQREIEGKETGIVRLDDTASIHRIPAVSVKNRSKSRPSGQAEQFCFEL